MIRVMAVAAIAWIGATTAALAASSFDCAKAASVMEKAICADPALSDMDRKLDLSYRAALARLSPPAQAQVRDGQRQWLRYAATVCGRTELPKEDSRARPPAQCLVKEYGGRQVQLDSAVTMRGGRTIYYVQDFRARPSTEPGDFDGNKPGFATAEVSYPQLDRPATPSEKKLNAKLAEDAKPLLAELSGDEDSSSDIKLSAAVPALFSFGDSSGSYAHGAAHGQYTYTSFHWLMRDGRLLKSSDIFSSQSKWQDFLRNSCFEAVKHFGKVETVKDVENTPVEPASWSFDQNGLTITFNPYEVAGYADGMPEVHIPWDKLRPYLAPTAPAILGGH